MPLRVELISLDEMLLHSLKLRDLRLAIKDLEKDSKQGKSRGTFCGMSLGRLFLLEANSFLFSIYVC